MSEESRDIIGKRILEALARLKKPQSWLAKEADMKPGYLNELIHGKANKRWNLDTLDKVRNVLGVQLYELTSGTEFGTDWNKDIGQLDQERQKRLLDYYGLLMLEQRAKE